MRALARRPVVCAALGAAVCALSTPLAAQDLAGTWRVTRDQVDVTVTEWGSACGPRPESHRNGTGREVSVRVEGDQLVISGGRTNRSNRCWSDNRDVSLVSATHPSATQWVVACSTPSSFALAERGTYTLTARDATHLSFRDETRYEWAIQGSNCRASSVLVREYERVGAVDAGPPPPPPPPPPPTRCATPGAPAALQVTPSRRSTTAGVRVCFRARLVDANRCEAQGPDVAWTMQRTQGDADATLDRSCFVPTATSGTGEFEVTAMAGGFTARAVAAVVTADRYRDLVATHLEDPDAGVDAPLLVGPRVGAVAVATPRSAPRSSFVVWGLALFAALLGVAGLALLTRRRSRERSAREAGSDAIPSVAEAPVARPPVAEAPVARPPVAEAPVAEAPVAGTPVKAAAPFVIADSRACSRCGTRYGSDLAFCPQDGAALVEASATSAPRPAPAAAVVATPVQRAPTLDRICPTCKRRYPSPTEFCGEDGSTLVSARS